MRKKKRQRLTDKTAKSIKLAIVKKTKTLAEIAEKYGVSTATVAWIKSDRSHTDIKVPGWSKRGYRKHPVRRRRSAA